MVVVERRRARAGLGGGERKKCELEKKELRWRIKREKKKGGGGGEEGRHFCFFSFSEDKHTHFRIAFPLLQGASDSLRETESLSSSAAH